MRSIAEGRRHGAHFAEAIGVRASKLKLELGTLPTPILPYTVSFQ